MWHLHFSQHSLLLWCPDSCTMSGRFSSLQNPSRSREPEQLPWQHQRNEGGCGSVTFGSCAVSVHTSLLPATKRHLRPPTLQDHSRKAKAAATEGLPIRKPFKTSPLKSCQTYKKKNNPHSPAYSRLLSSSLFLFLCPLHPHTHTHMPTQLC